MTSTATRPKRRRAASVPAREEAVAVTSQKAIDVLREKFLWAGRRMAWLSEERARLDAQRDAVATEANRLVAERAALAVAIRELGGDPEGQQ